MILDTPRQSLKADGKALEIAYAQETDTAIYTCIATNAAGDTQQVFDLEILGKRAGYVYLRYFIIRLV